MYDEIVMNDPAVDYSPGHELLASFCGLSTRLKNKALSDQNIDNEDGDLNSWSQ